MKNCPSCRKDCPDDMALCGYCGSPLSRVVAGSPLAGPEEEIWSGGYSGKAEAFTWFLYFVWICALGYGWIRLGKPQVEKIEWQVGAAALAGIPFVFLFLRLLYRKWTVRYRVTTQRLFKTEGILFRKIDEVELIRVDDLEVRQSLFQRLSNVGTVIVFSPTDQTEPQIYLRGISKPIAVKEKIREQVRRLRQRSITLEQI